MASKKLIIDKIKWDFAPKKNSLPKRVVLHVSEEEYERIKNGEPWIWQDMLKHRSGGEFEVTEAEVIYG